MNRFTLFETSILGLFAGAVVSAYLVFLDSTGGFIGQILSWISLKPLLNLLNFPTNHYLLYSFLFFVIVFTIYGFIIGLAFRIGKKTKFLFLATIALILVGGFFEQKNGFTLQSQQEKFLSSSLTTELESTAIIAEQYFGKEAKGDLNADGKNDIAFITSRNDKDRGILYYLLASLKISRGNSGTNLMFLGDKLEPKSIDIKDGRIIVECVDYSNKKATTTKLIYAKVTEGNLVEVKNIDIDSKAATTSPIKNNL